MFVNISPADYNLDESQASLIYAARVKQITNDCVKNFETREITKLKDLVRTLHEENEALKFGVPIGSQPVQNNINKEGLVKLQMPAPLDPSRVNNNTSYSKKFVFKTYTKKREESDFRENPDKPHSLSIDAYGDSIDGDN